MSYKDENRQALITYLEDGAKPQGSPPILGVEVEHFVVHADTLEAVPYKARDGATGVLDILNHLKAFYPHTSYSTDGALIALSSEEATVTLEPAAQLEFSMAPYSSLADIQQVYHRFREHLNPFLDERGLQIKALGYHPRAKAHDLTLIPKKRYRLMDAYFAHIKTHGERMMRASASTQVSVDYTSEADAIRKMRVAQALAPILGALTNNTTTFEGEPTTLLLERLNLWRDVDNARCGCIPGIFDEDFGFGAYADWLLRTCPIFVMRPAEGEASDTIELDGTKAPNAGSTKDTGRVECAVFGVSAADAYASSPMDKADIEHLISMFWPDVRLKQVVEIRPADSLPEDLVVAYAALVKGIFYSEDSLTALEEAFGVRDGVWPLNDTSTNDAIAAIRANGNSAYIFGKTLAEWESLLLGLAYQALDASERLSLMPLVERADVSI